MWGTGVFSPTKIMIIITMSLSVIELCITDLTIIISAMDDVSDKWRDVENQWTLDFLVYGKPSFFRFSSCHVIWV